MEAVVESTMATTIASIVNDPNLLWIVIVGLIVSFILANGIGANDVANSFGTSVGSKVLTLRTACLLATVFEISGSVLIGYKVSDTIRKGIIDVSMYKNEPREYMLGNLAALFGSAIWLIIATFLKMPISGTHSIVGSVLGFSFVAHGTEGVKWPTMFKIVASWFISPLMAGAVSTSIFLLIRRFILSKSDPFTPGLRSLPIFYGLTVFVNIISVTLDGPDMLKVKMDQYPWFEPVFAVSISLLLGLIVAAIIYYVMVPKLSREIQEELTEVPVSHALTGSNTGDLVVFVIGNGNISPEDSKEQTPINISMSDFHTNADKSLEAGLNGNGYINSNGFVEPNHNHQHHHHHHINVSEKNAKNETLSNLSNGKLLSNNGKHHVTSLDVIPVDGLSPNGSATPLIKSGTGTTVSMDSDTNVIHMNDDDDDGGVDPPNRNGDKVSVDDRPGVGKLFSMLQILTAAFGSFAHGGNDVSNAIGPLIALWLVYTDGNVAQKSQTPVWILIYGGVGISLGLWIWGRRVIKTMGEDLTKITPSSGFTIEIGAAITVLLASKVGVPVSTTHCKVGSVCAVGHVRTKGGVDWRLFRNIFFAWIVTVPVSAALSAVMMLILRAVAA